MIARRRRNNSDSEDRPNPYNRYQNNTGQTFVAQTPPPPSDFSLPVIDTEMSCRDRTSEFSSAVKSLQSRHVNGAVQTSRRSAAIKHRSEFTKIAKYDLNYFKLFSFSCIQIVSKLVSIFNFIFSC